MKPENAFSPGRIGNLVIKNHIVRAATGDIGNTSEGEVTDVVAELYRRLAAGGSGLIVTGHASPYPGAIASPHMTRIHDDVFIHGIRKIARAVHAVQNGCRVFLQLNHPGRQILPHMPVEPVAPSAVFHPRLDALEQPFKQPRALAVDEIEEIVACFGQGIRRAREAEFDGVEIHAAHGWLLSSFLSPHTNRRQDAYGGTVENRTRIVRQIIENGRKRVGDDFPITVKINTDDCVPGGVVPVEAAKIAGLLTEAGCNAVIASGGMWEALTRSEEELGWKPVPIPEARVGIRTKDQEAYFLPGAIAIKESSNVPVILVGGIKSLDVIEGILASGRADFCALCRPLIREPDLPHRWNIGKGSTTSECISCNECMGAPDPLNRCRHVASRSSADG